jgi:ATP-dependent helicase HrpA
LVELALQKDLAWMEKDLRGLTRHAALYAGLGDPEELPALGLENLKCHLLPREVFPAWTEVNFKRAVDAAREAMRGLAVGLVDRVGEILQIRRQVKQDMAAHAAQATPLKGAPAQVVSLKDFSQLGSWTAPASVQPGPAAAASRWEQELNGLLPERFLTTTPCERLEHLPRYLKALQVRMERARLNPRKDQDKARWVAPYVEAWRGLAAQQAPTATAARELDRFRWMIEEYKVSIFAQELGTAFPVSAKRMEEALVELRRWFA